MQQGPRVPRRCWAEIDLSAIQRNALVAAQASRCGLIPIIKADGYGHGAVPVARALEAAFNPGVANPRAPGLKLFGVATMAEADELKAAGINTPVLLLGSCLPDEREIVIENGFVPCVSSLAETRAWDSLAKRNRKAPFAVHAMIDTGMGRIGFAESEWNAKTISALAALKHVRVDGVASHFPSADEDVKFTRGQIQRFGELQVRAVTHGLTPRHCHLGNSAGVLGYPGLHTVSNVARPGLMLYGVSPLPEFQPLLIPALTWKTHVTMLRNLPRGRSISYGRTFVTKKPMRVATLAVGYADGYPRHLSGRDADVLIRGRRCRLLGRVTMDQIIVDVTRVPAAAGDEVVLIGAQGREEITAGELAKKAGTIPWEILTRITSRVERVWDQNPLIRSR